MAIVPLKDALPRIYFDWSHLVRAYSDSSDASGLRCAVERSSAEANLILSEYHIIELINYADRKRTLEIAHWLDSLDHIWIVADRERLPIYEACQYLLKVSGQQYLSQAEIFSRSIVWVFAGKYGQEVIAEALEDPTIRGLAKRTHGHQSEAMVELRTAVLDGIRKFRKDEVGRKAALGKGKRRHEWSNKRFVDIQLAKLLTNARAELLRRGIEVCSVDKAMRILRDESRFEVFRYLWIRDLVLRTIADHIQSIPSESSLAMDLYHLVGVAYCDVFTCDKLILSILHRLPDVPPPMGVWPRSWLAGSPDIVAKEINGYLDRVSTGHEDRHA